MLAAEAVGSLVGRAWIADYGATLREYGMTLSPDEVPREFTTLLATIIGGIVPVPGYEYQFVTLLANSYENATAMLGLVQLLRTALLMSISKSLPRKDGGSIRSARTLAVGRMSSCF